MASPLGEITTDPYNGMGHWNITPTEGNPTKVSSGQPNNGLSQSPQDAAIQIPASGFDSSTSGRRSNALAQIPRVVPNSGDLSHPMYDTLLPYCVCFTSSGSGLTQNSGYERTMQIASVESLNEALKEHPFALSLPLTQDELLGDMSPSVEANSIFSGPEINYRDGQGRLRKEPTGFYDPNTNSVHMTPNMYGYDLGALPREDDCNPHVRGPVFDRWIDDVRIQKDSLFSKTPSDHQRLIEGRISALKILQEWTFDGVLQASELLVARRGQQGKTNLLFNVGVRGPSQLRNGWDMESQDYPQLLGSNHKRFNFKLHQFDPTPCLRDDFYVCLCIVFDENKTLKPFRDGVPGKVVRAYRFQYQCWSGRRIRNAYGLQKGLYSRTGQLLVPTGPANQYVNDNTTGESDMDKSDIRLVHTIVGAWRVGSVLDTKSATSNSQYGKLSADQSPQVLLSVDGRWISMAEIAARLGILSTSENLWGRDIEQWSERPRSTLLVRRALYSTKSRIGTLFIRLATISAQDGTLSTQGKESFTNAIANLIILLDQYAVSVDDERSIRLTVRAIIDAFNAPSTPLKLRCIVAGILLQCGTDTPMHVLIGYIYGQEESRDIVQVPRNITGYMWRNQLPSGGIVSVGMLEKVVEEGALECVDGDCTLKHLELQGKIATYLNTRGYYPSATMPRGLNRGTDIGAEGGQDLQNEQGASMNPTFGAEDEQDLQNEQGASMDPTFGAEDEQDLQNEQGASMDPTFGAEDEQGTLEVPIDPAPPVLERRRARRRSRDTR